MIQSNVERPTRSRTLAFGLVLAVLLALSSLAAGPAHAETTFTVTSTGDEGDASLADPFCDVDPSLTGFRCTLRAAIQEANATTGADVIHFSIPGDGPHTISPASELPQITDQVTIDGYTQGDLTPDPADDAKENTLATGGTNAVLKIQLNGEKAVPPEDGSRDGLDLAASNSEIKGLVVNRFGNGINVGGTGNSIEGNFIGTDPSGTLDAGNTFDGVAVFDASNTIIGDTTPEARNLISGNGTGIRLARGEGNKVQGNLIGTDRNGIGPLGNSSNGVSVLSAFGNEIIGGTVPGAANTIAFSNGDGVSILFSTSTGVQILSNRLFSNGDLGIDLGGNGRTANDPNDFDIGANNLQNFPVLTEATTSRDSTVVRGILDSAPNETFKVQFYSNPLGTNEGQKLIGQKGVSTDERGDVSFSFRPARKVPEGRVITATATSASGDTSEFSVPRRVIRR